MLTEEEFRARLKTYLKGLGVTLWLDWDISRADKMEVAIEYMVTLWKKLDLIRPNEEQVPKWFTHNGVDYLISEAPGHVLAEKLFQLQKNGQQDTSLFKAMLDRFSPPESSS